MRFGVRAIRAGGWALIAVTRVRHQLRSGGLDSLRMSTPPRDAGPAAERALAGVLRRRGASCLESAVVRQAWRAGHGDQRDVVIGVRPPADGFQAHAWLAGDPEDTAANPFTELTREPWVSR